MLEGIVPIVFTPFDENGDIDADGLRRIVRFELDGGVHGLGINGFASEAYKMTDGERRETLRSSRVKSPGRRHWLLVWLRAAPKPLSDRPASLPNMNRLPTWFCRRQPWTTA